MPITEPLLPRDGSFLMIESQTIREGHTLMAEFSERFSQSSWLFIEAVDSDQPNRAQKPKPTALAIAASRARASSFLRKVGDRAVNQHDEPLNQVVVGQQNSLRKA